ncbi:hypothetical protein MJI69_30465, partial [Salmonella enterica subsp. enterica serovar Anatum]|nr:hypothetical protein [Salmonella enterica subsp. enterica serovar Anatum]
SVKEKIGYGMGDAASHIIFDNVMLYMMFFYTDIFGIPAGFVGINIPIGVAGILYARKYMPNFTTPRRKFDMTGFFLFGLSLVLF